MRFLLAIIPVVALAPLLAIGGCSSLFDRTAVVTYVDSARFYVRQNPIYDGEADVQRSAEDVCASRSARAELTEQLQPYPYDIRYAVYRCVPRDAAG